jgi:hypothetical protein
MFKQARGHALAVFLTLALANLGYAQPSANAPAPESIAAPLWRMDPVGPTAGILPGPGCATGPSACALYEDRNGPLLVGSRLLDGSPAIPGWFGGIDVGVVVPHITNKLTSPVTLTNGTTDLVHLPTAELGVRVMPKLELGYRWGQAAGELMLSYRVLNGQGSQAANALDLPPFAPVGAALKSRLDQQLLDLDYGSYEPSLGPLWDMKWRAGLRFANTYADSQAFNAGLFQQTTNRFWGVGPHAMLDVRRWIGGSGLALFGRLETSLPIGRLEQKYSETATAADGTLASGQSRLQQNMPILSVAFQAGVSWSPCRGDRFRLTAGYTIEHWWDLGAIGALAGSSREELAIQGGFLRAEWNY